MTDTQNILIIGSYHYIWNLYQETTVHQTYKIQVSFFLIPQNLHLLTLMWLTLTFRTSLAWNSGVQLWWIIPIPPMSYGKNQWMKWKSNYDSVQVLIYNVSVSVTYSHSDGHGGLCDCVHGRGNEWRLQGYLAGQGRCQILWQHMTITKKIRGG